MTSSAGKKNNYHTHPAQYPKSKGNHIMKFGQLIEYKMTNIFLQKSCTKCGGEISPRYFFKKVKIKHISGSTVYTFCFYCLP